MIQSVFLDLDNTLLDFTRSEANALGQTLRERGISPTEEMLRRYHVINMECWERLETGELTKDVGSVLVGEQAVSEGLIDELGGIHDAYDKLYKMLDLTEMRQKR